MLSIRLTRTGKKKHPLYRLIVTEKTRDPWGKYLENLGTYNPHTKATVLKNDRIKHWLEHGAQPSPTAHNLLVTNGLAIGEKVRASKSKPGKKKSAQIALKKAEEASLKAQAEAAAAAEKEAKEAEAIAPSEPTPEAAPAAETTEATEAKTE